MTYAYMLWPIWPELIIDTIPTPISDISFNTKQYWLRQRSVKTTAKDNGSK